jgi:outer membrane protein assembly factor BamB
MLTGYAEEGKKETPMGKNVRFGYVRLALMAVTVCLIVGAASLALASFGDKLWTVELPGRPWRSSPAISANGTLYIGATSGTANLTAVAPDGTKQWSVKVGASSIYSSPAISANGTIYIGAVDNTDGNLTAVAPDGTRLWSIKLGADTQHPSPAISSNGTIYMAAYDGTSDANLTAIAPDGTREWSIKIGGGSIYSSPAIAVNGTVYIGTPDGNLTAVAPDGTREWMINLRTSSAIQSTPTISSNGTIYIVARGGAAGNLTAVAPSGTREWMIKIDSSASYGSPAIAANGTIYIGTTSGNLTAVAPDGTREWTVQVGSPAGHTSPAVSANGTIYISHSNGNLTAVSKDGAKLWSVKAGTQTLYSSPAIAANGTVYFAQALGSGVGNLTAVEGDGSGLANSAWPKFHQNARNTGRYIAAVDPVPGQDVEIVITTTNSTVISAQTLSSTYGIGATPVTQQKAFTAKIDTNGAVCKFRYEITGVANSTDQLSFYKLFADGTHRLYVYAGSDSEVEDGKWWMATADGVYMGQDATLKKSSTYYLYFCIKDNGDYDINTTLGEIEDPSILVYGGSSSSSSSSGCSLNPHADFNAEWLLLALAPLIWVVRNRKNKTS